ncbi:MAG TPA: heme exporter protein CcmD [Rhodospirillaceae bacterium]|nr:heme exporter protein CcmD [Rhodospirillaceae bacterium]
MGGHGIYIWPAYMIATAVIVSILAHTLHTMRQRERHLDLLRRKRRGVDDGDEV